MPPRRPLRNACTALLATQAVGIISDLGDVFRQGQVSIYSILQNPIVSPDDDVFVVVTDPVDVSKIKIVCVSLEANDWCLGDIFYMPVL